MTKVTAWCVCSFHSQIVKDVSGFVKQQVSGSGSRNNLQKNNTQKVNGKKLPHNILC